MKIYININVIVFESGGHRGRFPPESEGCIDENFRIGRPVNSKHVSMLEQFPVLFSNIDILTNEKLIELKLHIEEYIVKPALIVLQEVKPKNLHFERNE